MALTLAWGHGESCPGGGRFSRRACTGSSSLRPGHTSLGDGEALPRRWLVIKEGMGGTTVPNGPGTLAWGTGSAAQAVVGAQGGLAGGSSSQRPGLTSLGGRGFPPRRWLLLTEGVWVAVAPNGLDASLGGRGVLPKRWLVLKEGLRGLVVPNGPGTTASGDGSSCPSGGQCPRSASGGQ